MMIMKFAYFSDKESYNVWYTQIKLDKGYTDENCPYWCVGHLLDPITYPQIIARIDSRIDTEGLTIWDETTAIQNGFIDPAPFIRQKIIKRKEFWNKLTEEYSASNQLQGISFEQTIHTSTRFTEVMILGLSGALETVVDRLQNMVPDDMSEEKHWITQDQLDSNISQTQTFLDEE